MIDQYIAATLVAVFFSFFAFASKRWVDNNEREHQEFRDFLGEHQDRITRVEAQGGELTKRLDRIETKLDLVLERGSCHGFKS